MEMRAGRWHASTTGAISGSIRRLVQDGQREARKQRRDDWRQEQTKSSPPTDGPADDRTHRSSD